MCHQTVGLVARHLEANGIPTVIVGAALDIADYCGVPRFLFTDFPLGNPCGKPWDTAMQQSIVAAAFDLLEQASAPRATVRTPHAFAAAPEAWRENYLRLTPKRREELRQAGEQRRRLQREVKTQGRARED